jgi:lipopolysaccharide transport system ATP-binding protein
VKPIIEVSGLGKRYRIGDRVRYRTLRESLVDAVSAPVRQMRGAIRYFRSDNNSEQSQIWALREVSLEVMPGEVLGVIGRNGAGKSTLLKILSRITEPTEGWAELRGRIGSLLEVGTGFHPELTGRENIHLSGAILGMRRLEIRRRLDEIIAFAEVERFIDTAIKHYSSGMYTRLAFAVAAHLETEILLVDEVLAVGDIAFQKKCLGKMSDVAKAGRTILFVSHNLAAVQQLTTRCICLDRGALVFQGATASAIERYINEAGDLSVEIYEADQHGHRLPNLSRAVEFVQFRIRDHVNKMLEANQDLVIVVTLKGNADVHKFRLSMTIFGADGSPVGSTFGRENLSIRREKYSTVEFRLPNPRLAPGAYYCGMAVGSGDHTTGHTDFDVILNILHFEVLAPEGVGGTRAYWTPSWGMVLFPEAVTGEINVTKAG